LREKRRHNEKKIERAKSNLRRHNNNNNNNLNDNNDNIEIAGKKNYINIRRDEEELKFTDFVHHGHVKNYYIKRLYSFVASCMYFALPITTHLPRGLLEYHLCCE
jgi:hypothetical protein